MYIKKKLLSSKYLRILCQKYLEDYLIKVSAFDKKLIFFSLKGMSNNFLSAAKYGQKKSLLRRRIIFYVFAKVSFRLYRRRKVPCDNGQIKILAPDLAHVYSQNIIGSRVQFREELNKYWPLSGQCSLTPWGGGDFKPRPRRIFYTLFQRLGGSRKTQNVKKT